MSIALVIPTLGRPQLLGPLAMNVSHTLRSPYTLLFVVDPDDEATKEVVGHLGNARILLAGGTYPQKINAGVDETHEPVVALLNDDVVFHTGWHQAALRGFTNGIEVVGPSDLSPATENGENATFPIVKRSYIEDPGAAWGEKGTTLHEGYHHNFSESELWHLAVHRGVAKHVPECVIEHIHPDWAKAQMDETYWRGAYKEGAWAQDEALFGRRQAEWLS